MKQKSKLICIIFILVFFMIPFAGAAEQILRVELVVTKDNSVIVKNIKGMIGTPDQEDNLEQDYSIKMTGAAEYNSYIPLQFVIYTDPPNPTEDILVTKRIPYKGNTGIIEVVYREETMLSYDLANLCNHNNICDGFENHITCANDCPLATPDGACIAEIDGICDPDCASRADSDCIEKEIKNSFIQSNLIRLVIFAILISFVAILLNHKLSRVYRKKLKTKRR